MTRAGRFVREQAGGLMLLAALVGLGARLAFGFGYWVGKPLTHDEHEYLALAENLARGQGFGYPSVPSSAGEERFSRPPLYPAFIALVAARPLTAGDRPGVIRRVKLAQAILGAAGVVLVGHLAQAAGPAAGVVAAVGAALHPPLVWMPAYVLSETLYSVLALAAALALARAIRRLCGPVRDGAGRRLVLAGLVAGAAALTRSVGLLFVALAVAWLAWRRSARAAVVFLAAAVVVIAPWSLRMTLVHGRPILVAADGGINFWIGNHPLARGEGDLAANPLIKDANRAFRARHGTLTPEALEPCYWRDAWRSIAERPLWWMSLLARKAFYAVVPVGPSYTLHSRRYYAATLLSYGPLLLVGLAGLRRFSQSGSGAVPVFLLGGSTLLSEILFFPHERYRIPALDPALIVSAAAGIAARLGWSESR